MKRVLSIDIGAKKMYNTPKRKGKSGGAMEIQTIQIRHLFCNGFTNNHAEGDCHRKTLPYLSIVQATEGEYAIRLNDGPEAHTGCGGFFIAPSNARQTIVHHMDPRTGRMSARWIFLDAVLNELFPFDRCYRFPQVISGEVAAGLSARMDAVFAADTVYGQYSATFAMMEALAALSEPCKEGITDAAMYRVLQYLENHYRESVTASSLAQLAMQSESSLFVKFRQTFGVTPLRYLMEYRLSHAVRLLLCTDLSVREIGESVGYPDPFYFSKLFKRAYGQSPRAYRQNEPRR